mgnify:FL=1
MEKEQNHTPLVSIIMPTLNREKFIAETTFSIQKQTYTNWELIIMDDGSDDNTNKIVARLKETDDRIQYHNNGVKRITGKLKNRGIELAQGELIAFMDSDDLWHPEKLAKQVLALQQYPEAGFSFTNGCNFRDEDKVIEAIYYQRQSGAICADFFKSICSGDTGVFIQTVMVWKRLLHEENLFRINRTFTDYSFITNLAQQYKGVILYEVLLQRRIHPVANTKMNWVADYEEHIETIIRYKQAHKLDPVLASKILFITHINLGEEYLSRGMKKEARPAFRASWQYNKLSVVPFKKTAKSIVKR